MITAFAGIGYAVRRLTGKTPPDPSAVNPSQPQRTVEKMEQAAGEPVRP